MQINIPLDKNTLKTHILQETINIAPLSWIQVEI